ncbi:MAG TPA: hypothetical protein VL832_08595 [Puia sp.]|nr:hypothetical protein [Puia sp.]
MTLVKRKYKNRTVKFLLMAVYLFLFAAQINGRFYAVANFYVYGGGQPATAAKVTHDSPEKPQHPGKAVHLLVFKANHSNRSHLSLDKRYQGKYPFQVTSFSPLQALLTYADIRRKYTVCDQAIKSFDPTITSLRGPPCA